LPIAESIAHGRPVVCANFGAMAEVAELGGCHVCDVTSSKAITDAIEALVDDQFRRQVVAMIPARAALKKWSEYVDCLLEFVTTHENVDLSETPTIYVFLDATIRFKRNTGIQRVVRQLSASLAANGVEIVPITWNSATEQFVSVPREDLEFISQWNGPRVDSWSIWDQETVPKPNSWFLQAEVPTEHSSDFHRKIMDSARMLGLKLAHVFYDAIPVKLSEMYPLETSARHGEYMRQLIDYDVILPISEHSANDLGTHWRRESMPYRTIESKIRPIELAGEFTESSRVFTIPEKPMQRGRILTVSTLEPRKNFATLLQAFEIASEQIGASIELVIVGHYAYPEVVELVSEYESRFANLRWERNADDARLRELYTHCDFSIYPSVEEGFGLPILESLWNARPCISASFGSMGAIANDGGVLAVDVTNAKKLADAIISLASDNELYHILARQCTQRDFKTWRSYASDVVSQMRVQ